jgi:hypothetical protein
VYGREGHERYRLFPDAAVQVVTVGGRVYVVTESGGTSHAYELALGTGETVRAVQAERIWHLLGDAAPGD